MVREMIQVRLGKKERLDESMAKIELNLAFSTNGKNVFEIESESNI